MEDERKEADRIANMPLEDVNVHPRLARSLKRSGYRTLKEAFEEDEQEIQDVVGKLFKDFTGLVDSYLDDPSKFIRLMSQENRSSSSLTRSERKPANSQTPPRTQTNKLTRDRRFNCVTEHSLCTPHGEFLKQCQARAKSTFDTLCDRYDTVLVYQAFPAFSVEMDEIRESYLKLFKGYPSHPGKALDISRQFLPDLFLIFVADLARNSFSDDNLWGNFTEILPLSSNVLNDLKNLFIELLSKRGMPLYDQDEAATYYLYTVLLHAGLSEESWEDIWENSLIPLAKELKNGSIGYAGDMDGYAILKEVKEQDGKFSPGKETVSRILQKAPEFTLAPLFESALKAAMQIESKTNPAEEYVLVDSFELPEASLTALHDVVAGSSGRSPGRSRVADKASGSGHKQILSLPSADLCLDLARGIVSIKWSGRQYPQSFLGYRLDFYVDGVKRHEQKFVARLNKCVLEDVEVEVSPQSRYDIELRLMRRPVEQEDDFEVVSTHEQSFERSKPGCFEFIRGVNNVFRLRERKGRITRRRRIAYVVKTGFRIEPGAGMTLVEVYESSEGWSGSSAFVYDVEPGASGSIFMETVDGIDEEVAVWQESYRAHVYKQYVIGETLGGLDLFGFVGGENGINIGLPTITIEAANGSAAFKDLEITCSCNGKSVSVPKQVIWEDGLDGCGSSRIALALNRAWIDWLSEVVEVTARQVSNNGRVVFRYRFATIPIQNFKLESAHVDNGRIVADYSFEARSGIEITDFNGLVTEVRAHECYVKRMLLKDEYLPITITSTNGHPSVKAKLALAAIDVMMPEELTSLSRKRPICLADAVLMGTRKGTVSIKALGWRHNRFVYAKAGLQVVCVKELRQPTEISLNLLQKAHMFVPSDGDFRPRDLNMVISVGYGDEEDDNPKKPKIAWTDIETLRLREGLGFRSMEIAAGNGGCFACFDKPILCNAEVSFKKTGRRPKDLTEERVQIPKGSREFELPPEVCRQIHAGGEVLAQFFPKGRMGKVLSEYSFEIILRG